MKVAQNVKDPLDRKVFMYPFYFRIKATDVVNIKHLYTVMHEWFVEEEYCGDEKEFPEDFYYERRGGGEQMYLILWNFSKEPFGGPFIRRQCVIEMRIVGIKNIEIQYQGAKIKTQKGTVEIKTWWYLVYDYNKEWRNHWLLKHFLEIYVNRMFRKDFDMRRQELLRDAQNLQAALKEYFDIFSFKTEKPDLKRILYTEE
ncbi:MAG: hypothetical protein QW594_01335 [Candidatus Woesearchaeota archaeon]